MSPQITRDKIRDFVDIYIYHGKTKFEIMVKNYFKKYI